MAVNGADSVAIYIEGLASTIEEVMASNDLFMSPYCCIFKTPTILYRFNEKAYVPDAFSIGPFHHGHPNLADTERIKIKYLHGLISRSPSPKTILSDLFNSIQEVQTEARECYSKPIDYCPNEFVKILVIDGCFIIELFRKMVHQVPREDNDPIFTGSCMRAFLYHDLILLENQVPWMVLERLYNMTKEFDENESEDSKHHEALIKLATEFFGTTLSIFPPLPHQTIKDLKHIPDLIIKWMVSLIPDPDQISSRGEEGWRHMSCATSLVKAATKFIWVGSEMNISRWKPIPCATNLVKAGIKFRRVEYRSILDIKFKDGVLEIPPLVIQETTETVFRNIISFEQCYPNCKDWFTSYAMLMGSLINSAKDADILSKNEILDNWLSPEYAAQLFKNLQHNTYPTMYYYQGLSREVSRYCQRIWPRWRVAVLVGNCLRTPWALFSAVAAVIILILTFLQTVYSMKR